ncbi:FecR family protein [Mucilaginibacter agri]|uniref:DUF4974 domain-containing protein n=1 Tax=Mucilaginibacter agri TaxID=2695265 RepID=A0A965ZJK7_9SPHI|nr:FecR family protein [Mucilaginibacter agri]NCD72349.1 DUF4974 domain-containing protein [Mucilaginibacter agri]
MNWDILLKYINKQTTPEEDREVTNWLNEQRENKYLLDYLQRRSNKLNAELKDHDIQKEWEHLLDKMFEAEPIKGKVVSLRKFKYVAVAASLILVSVLGWLYLRPAKQHPQQFALQTPANMRGKVTLPDGTLVYMAPNSNLEYDNTYDVAKRIVHLSGEAFFDVKHQTNKPFIIYAQNNVKLTVLGTSFSFYSRKNRVSEVKVATGLVGITANKHTQFVKAGEQFNYTATNGKSAIQSVDEHDATSLQNETLYFKNNNAKEIAVKLQRWYNINVVVLPAAQNHPLFSGEMKDTGIDNLLKGLHYATGINYRYQNSKTLLLF